MGTGTLYETSRVLRSTSLQNTDLFDQFPLAVPDLIVESFFGDVVFRSAESIAETSALSGFHSCLGSLCG